MESVEGSGKVESSTTGSGAKITSRKLEVGKRVFSDKYGEGVINKIITSSTGYIEVQYDSGIVRKEMAFNLKDQKDGELLKKKPESATADMSKGEKKRFKDKIALEAFDKLPNQKKIESSLMSVNGLVFGDRHSLSYQIWQDRVLEIQFKAEEKGNEMIASIAKTIDKYMKVSDKQAYVLAKFADENDIKYS